MAEKKNLPEIRFKGFSEKWEERKFENDILSIKTGTNLLGATSNNGMPLLKMGNIQRGFFSFDKIEFLDENVEVENENIAYYGDFFFNTRNTLELVGKGATWTGDSGKFAFNSNIARFIFRRLDTICFNYLYNTKKMLSQVHARAMGTTSVAAIYPKSLKSLEYKLPSIEEQKRIGYFFHNLDHLITLHQSKYDKLVNVKKAMLEKMFPKKGDDVPEIRFKGFKEVWIEKKLGDITNTYSGGTPSVGNQLYYGGDIPFIRSGEIQAQLTELFITEKGLHNSSAKLVEKGDILYALYGATSGEVGISHINGAINQAILAIKPKNNYNSYFISQWLRKEKETIINTYLQGGQGNLSGSIVKELNINIPTNNIEQSKIGIFFKHIDHLLTLQQQELEKLKNIKKACLEKMFV